MERPDSKTERFQISNFAFHYGTTLSVELAYLDINPTASKVALVPTCFRGRLHGTLSFADAALRDHRIILVALFGNGESSSPSNTPGFPDDISYIDCVRAQHILLTSHLKIDTVDVVLGFSMGGQCAYHWAVMYPEMVQNAVVICSSARTSRHNYQFLEGPRAALESSVDYVKGQPKALTGVRAFGSAYSAWLTSAEWFEQEGYKGWGFDTLSAWDAAGRKSDEEWHPDNLLVMLRMWQRGDITSCYGLGGGTEAKSLEHVLSAIKARILVMPCETDQYFRPAASEHEAEHLERGTLAVIPSIWGHTAGGGGNSKDTTWMSDQISSFLKI